MAGTRASPGVSGFLVVRLPALNRDPAGRYPAFPAHAPCLGHLCYGGVDRMPWFEIDEEFYSGTLPEAIKRLRARVREGNPDFSGISVCKDLLVARTLLEYSNRHGQSNELVAIRSARLAEIKGTILFDKSHAMWLGYDVVSLGHWSLLSGGLFMSPTAFPGWESRVNGAGLFSSPTLSDEYARAYEIATARGAVEDPPLPVRN